jgi:hypothetical protein
LSNLLVDRIRLVFEGAYKIPLNLDFRLVVLKKGLEKRGKMLCTRQCNPHMPLQEAERIWTEQTT